MSTNIKSPLFILGAAPTSKVSIPNFFAEENEFVKLLEKPPYVRYMGWNMLTLDHPKIVDGQAWEVRNGDRKTIRLYRDGSFVAVTYADNSFLGWGQSDEDFQNNPRLNTLAVIEYVYEFVELYRNILSNFDSVKEVRFDVAIKNSKIGDKKLFAVAQKINDPFYGLMGETGELQKDFEAQVLTDFQIDNKDSSKFVAFKILEELFGRFGIPSDKIPYTNMDDANRRYVDIDSFPKN